MSQNIGLCMKPGAWTDYLAVQNACLPDIPDVSHLTPQVMRIQAGNPGEFQLQGTSTYLVGSGRTRILIDTGEGKHSWIENLTWVLDREQLEISHVLLTHWHGDHTGGVPDLVRQYPHLRAAIYKNAPDRGQHPIHDGQVFSVEGATVRALLAPGHSTDHMCFVLEEENALFTGDNVLGHGFTVAEHLGVFIASLEKMTRRNCSKGYPAHGVIIDNLPAKLQLYTRRYARRERQVMVGLRQYKAREGTPAGRASLSVKELVRQLYGNVSEEVSEMALEPSIDEMLHKLAEDGKVGWELAVTPWIVPADKRWFALEPTTEPFPVTARADSGR